MPVRGARQRSILFCLNGYGYFGKRSLRTAIQLAPYLQGLDSPAELRIFAVTDPASEQLDLARGALASLGFDSQRTRFCASFPDLLLQVRRHLGSEQFNEGDLFLVHDCSPTPAHHLNVLTVRELIERIPPLGRALRYLVEKPAMTTVNSQSYERRGISFTLPAQFLCDYVELGSLTLATARKWLTEHESDFQPTHLRVWRNGSTGFKKVFQDQRQGVTGGSLEDKAGHDLALTAAMFGLPAQGSVSVQDAVIQNYLVGSLRSDLISAAPNFRRIDDSIAGTLTREFDEQANEATRDKIAFEIAEARFWLSLDWPIEGKEQPLHCAYSFSWDGVNDSLATALLALIDPSLVGSTVPAILKALAVRGLAKWRGAEERSAKGNLYTISEARVHIIEDRSQQQSRALVLNFLTKFDHTEAWVSSIADGRVETVELESRYGGDNSLARVFLTAIDPAQDPAMHRILGWEGTSLIDRTMYLAKARAVDHVAPDGLTAMEEAEQRLIIRAAVREAGRWSGLIINLDNTLVRTDRLPPQLLDPVLDVIEFESADHRELIRQRLFESSLDLVLVEYGLMQYYGAAADKFAEIVLPDSTVVELHDDAREFLDYAITGKRRFRHVALITRGFDRLQSAKIDQLGLRGMFGEECYLIDLHRGHGRGVHRSIMSGIIGRWADQDARDGRPQITAGRVLVIGHEPKAELKWGLELGMDTIWVSRGRSDPKSPHRTASGLEEVSKLL